MKKSILLLSSCFFILVLACSSNSSTVPGSSENEKSTQLKTIDTITVIKNHIQKNFPNQTLHDHKVVNLNDDELFDLVVLTNRECTKEDEYVGEDSSCRTVILFINIGEEKFKINATNNFLVECSDCGGAGVGDPHQGILFENGILSFESLYGACDKTAQSINFTYDKVGKLWWLQTIEKTSYNCQEPADGEEVKTYNSIKTKKDFGSIRFSDYGK